MLTSVLFLTACAGTSTISKTKRTYPPIEEFNGKTMGELGKYTGKIKQALKECRFENSE